MQKIINVAQYYITYKISEDRQYRFDVIEVFLKRDEGTVLTRTGKKGNYTRKKGNITVGKNTGYYIKKGSAIIHQQ